MKTLFGSRSKMLLGIVVFTTILGISNSCTKSDNMYGTGGNPGGKGGPGTNEVWIQGMAFNPSSITVKEGTTITWTNKDAVAHTVTSDANLFNSGSSGSGKTYTYTFSTEGTYQYHCSIHPTMTAKVIVTSSTTSSAAVSINSMSFAPATITVSAGTTITWTNQDAIAHTVTSDTGLFNSGSISSSGYYGGGGTYSYKFTTAGTYPYHCSIHPSMKGTIVVN